MIQIIDDFLPLSLSRYLEDLLANPSYPYSFIRDVTSGDGGEFPCPDNFPKDKQTIGFASTPFADYRAVNKEFAYFQMFHVMVHDALPTTHNWILNRLRVGLNVPRSTKHDQWDVDYHRPHIDSKADGLGGDTISALYYVNETDGDTVIFDEQGLDMPSLVTVKQRVEPKQNRLLLFDGAYYHASSSPKHHDYRIVITMNYHDKMYNIK
jgi:hypothetical protein